MVLVLAVAHSLKSNSSFHNARLIAKITILTRRNESYSKVLDAIIFLELKDVLMRA